MKTTKLGGLLTAGLAVIAILALDGPVRPHVALVSSLDGPVRPHSA